MLRRLYDWTLSLAAKPSAPYALAAVSFAESSFFPIPPDVMLVPMMLARPDRAWFYALVCTVASVVGGVVGYMIGLLLYDSIGAWLFQLYGLTEGAASFVERIARKEIPPQALRFLEAMPCLPPVLSFHEASGTTVATGSRKRNVHFGGEGNRR